MPSADCRTTQPCPHPPRGHAQDWCRANDAECLAVQPPGRNMRGKEPPFTSCEALAAALLPVLASRLLGAPYVVSLGAQALPE